MIQAWCVKQILGQLHSLLMWARCIGSTYKNLSLWQSVQLLVRSKSTAIISNKVYFLVKVVYNVLVHCNVCIISSGEVNSDYKAGVKQWLYRKILLDEFRVLDLAGCQRHLQQLRQALLAPQMPANSNKRKKTKIKPLTQVLDCYLSHFNLYLLITNLLS